MSAGGEILAAEHRYPGPSGQTTTATNRPRWAAARLRDFRPLISDEDLAQGRAVEDSTAPSPRFPAVLRPEN
jgi:hypothetical protein